MAEISRIVGLEEPALSEYSNLISSELIPGLIKIADRYGYDRDSIVEYCANQLSAMSEVASFKNYRRAREKMEVKENG